MAQQTINLGTTANDGTGDPLRTAFIKTNANFTDLYNQIGALDLNAVIPSQVNQGGSILTTNGTNLLWVSAPATNTLNNGAYTVVLGSDGTLSLPDAPGASAAVIQPLNNGYGVNIVSGGNSWKFNTNSSLTFPDTSVQTTAYTGWPVLNATGSSGPTAIAIGYNASAGVFGVSIGDGAGAGNQSGSSISSSSINIGYNAGNAGQLDHTIAIGSGAGNSSQGRIAIAIGYQAGSISQGNYAIAIGANAGYSNQPANTIILNATSSNLNGVSSQTSSFYVAPVRSDATPTNVLYYNTTTNEVTYGTLAAAAGTLTGTTLNSTVVTFASTTATQTINFANGITANGNTNTVNIATGGVSGSTTQVTIGSPSGTSGVNINGVTTHSAAVKFNGALQSGSGTTNITLTNNGPTMNGTTTMGIVATAQTAGTIASAATIAPTNPITFVSGNTQITTITPPSGIATYGGQITLIPIGTWTTATGGNIGLATTAVTNKALIMTYDAGTTKWYPSY
jgi:hypothetical protein